MVRARGSTKMAVTPWAARAVLAPLLGRLPNRRQTPAASPPPPQVRKRLNGDLCRASEVSCPAHLQAAHLSGNSKPRNHGGTGQTYRSAAYSGERSMLEGLPVGDLSIGSADTAFQTPLTNTTSEGEPMPTQQRPHVLTFAIGTVIALAVILFITHGVGGVLVSAIAGLLVANYLAHR